MANTKSSAKSSPAKRPATTAKTPAVKAAAAAKPAVKAKAPAKKAAVAKVEPKPVRAKPAAPRGRKPKGVPIEQRRHYVEVAAYHIAERRGFAPGDPLQDWVQAEAEIDRLLAEGRIGG